MSTESTDAVLNDVAEIGAVAGLIWRYLSDHGPVTLSKLAKEIKDIGASRDLVMQGLGWLAREDKLRFVETPRSKLVGLASNG